MKILAINGSPRGAKGNTERILQPFLTGAREAGAETEVVYLKGKKIEHCLGCFSCWAKTPGVCVHKDDMPELLEKLRTVDMVIFATPLYIYTVSGLMKDFMDRMIPNIRPYMVQRGHHFTHPSRYPKTNHQQFVLISNAGFPERHHFSGLEETFRCLTDSHEEQLAGMICCAGGELLKREALQDGLAWYLEAAQKAGREMVLQGNISPETQAVLDRPLVDDPAAYASTVNAYWASTNAEPFESPESASQPASDAATPLPAPQSMDTMRDLVAGMALSFNAEAADGLQAVIQFDVTDENPGQYYLDIAGKECTAFAGLHAQPTLTIHTPADVWMAVSRGELNGATAMMSGKYSIDGNLGLLIQLDKLFSAAP